MKEQVQKELEAIEKKLSKGNSLENEDILKLLTLKLIATKNEK